MESINTSINDVLTLAKKLIEIPSTVDNKDGLEEVISFATNQLPDFSNQQFLSNGIPSVLVHNATPGTKHFKLILNGHLDVVPGKKDLFKPYVKEGKLYGRGAYDMKAGAAGMIVLFKELAKTVTYPLALQLVTDEEIGGHNGTKYQIEKGITADFVIAGENSDVKIVNKAKSILWIKITISGKASHAAYLWLGENALWNMYDFLKKLESQYPLLKKPSWETTINVAKIETPNTTFNKVPDECTAWLDVRVTPEEGNTVLETIKKLLPKDAKIEIETQEKAAYTDSENPFIIHLQETIKKVTNDTCEITGSHGASDIRFYNTMVNVPGIEFGPKGSGAHSDTEWVDIKSLEDYYNILKSFLLSVK